MGGAFFVSRTDLLNWLNEVLQLNYTDLKQAANGAAFCQVIDVIYPGKGLLFPETKTQLFLFFESSDAKSQF